MMGQVPNIRTARVDGNSDGPHRTSPPGGKVKIRASYSTRQLMLSRLRQIRSKRHAEVTADKPGVQTNHLHRATLKTKF